MYHDRYSRRRATDSFHEEDVPSEPQARDHCSWTLFMGVLLVQVTSRSIWASLGVILAFLLDEGPSWILLTTPTSFAVAWGLTEPCVNHMCKRMDNIDHFMYMVMAGTTLGWLGTMVAVKCPIKTVYLIILIGIIGGCGGSISATASTSLVRKHFPRRSGAIRFFEQITASLSFSLMPVISYFIMDTFGEHGGLLIHSGVLMQGLVGGALLRGAKWKDNEPLERRPRSYAFRRDEGDPFISSESSSEENVEVDSRSEIVKHTTALHIMTEEQRSCKTWKSPNSQGRIAFGLNDSYDSGGTGTPPERRRKKKALLQYCALPSISENAEEDENSFSDNIAEEDSQPDVVHLEETSPTTPPPSPPPLPLSPEKPPRTYKHLFPNNRLLASAHDDIGDHDSLSKDAGSIILDSETGEAEIIRSSIEENYQPEQKYRQTLLQVSAAPARLIWSTIKQQGLSTQVLFSNPLIIPAAFLQFSTQSALLTFMSLNPALLRTIEDGTKMDGAYCICIMGFTWLGFVLASPCFSVIHFSSHQFICVLALCTSSLTLYMVTITSTLDGLVLNSCLFGLSYGVARLTSYSLLKMCFGPQPLNDFTTSLTIFSAVFHLLYLLLISLCGWGDDLKILYVVPSICLVVAAAFWIIQVWVSSIRAKRGRHEFTWSRRRRVS